MVVAPDGKKVGKNFETGGEYAEIEGAFYSGFDTDDEYITIPDPLDGEYKFEIQGTGDGGEFEIEANYINENASVSKSYSSVIQPNEIIETTLITKAGENISLDLITQKIEEDVPVLASNQVSSSKSGSRHQSSGEVLGVSVISDDQIELQIKLISLLNELIKLLHLYVAILKVN